jgi:hypothetical protein
VINVSLDRVIVEVLELESNLAENPRVALCLETKNMSDLLSGYGTDCDKEISDSVRHIIPPGPHIDVAFIVSQFDDSGRTEVLVVPEDRGHGTDECAGSWGTGQAVRVGGG